MVCAIPSVLLSKVSEHVYDCHCFSKCSSVFYFVSLLLQRVVFPLFILADMLLCCQIWNLFNLISGSSLNPIQVDLEPKSREGLSTYEDIGICEFSSMLKLFKLPIFPKLLSEVKDTRIQVFHKLLRLRSLALRGVQNLTSWGLYPKPPPAYHNILFKPCHMWDIQWSGNWKLLFDAMCLIYIPPEYVNWVSSVPIHKCPGLRFMTDFLIIWICVKTMGLVLDGSQVNGVRA